MPDSFAEAENGLLMVANGIDPVLKWDGYFASMEQAGVPAPETAVTGTGSGTGNLTGTYYAYVRFVDRDGNYSNLSPISAEFELDGDMTVTYTNVPLPGVTNAARRQILRNTDGQTTTFYVDVDTPDLGSTTFSSTKDDDTLSAQESQALLDSTGRTLANLFTVPPSHKAYLASHATRMWLAGEVAYTEGSVAVTLGSTTVTGIGTEWKDTFEGRFLYVTGSPEVYEIESVDEDEQTLTLTSPYLGATDAFADYGIRPAPAERNLLYYTEAGQPQAWPSINAMSIPEDGDDITGLMPLGSYLYILKRRRIYRLTIQSDPATDGFIFSSATRGCVNNRCWVTIGEMAYLMDEDGVYAYDGGDVQAVSEPIAGIFQGTNEHYKVNWDAARFFHAIHDPFDRCVRFFVSMGGDYLPRHALVLSYGDTRWWVEEYPMPIGASTLGRIGSTAGGWRTSSREQVFLGGPARKVMALDSLRGLDGPKPGTGTTRGTVTSSGLFTLTDSQASFPDSSTLVGFPIAIVKGRGKGHRRKIVSVSGTTIRVDMPWTEKPDTTSVYQIGAIRYVYRTGRFRFADSEPSNVRRFELVFRPYRASRYDDEEVMNYRLYHDWDDVPTDWYTRYVPDETGGIEYTPDDPDAEVNLEKDFGRVEMRMDAQRERYTDAPSHIAFELWGDAGEGGADVRHIIINGVTGFSVGDGSGGE